MTQIVNYNKTDRLFIKIYIYVDRKKIRSSTYVLSNKSSIEDKGLIRKTYCVKS